MQSVIYTRSHVVATSVIILLVIGTACNIRGFEDTPYPTPRIVVSTPEGIQQEDVTLTYQLIEVNGLGSDIVLEFSTDGGQTWNAGTAKGGNGTTDVKGMPYPGAVRTIVWGSFEDGISGTQTCRIKVIPMNRGSGVAGTPDETRDFEVQNPDFPVISWIAKPEGAVRQVQLSFAWKLETPAIPILNYYYGLDEDPPTGVTSNTSVTIPAPSAGAHTFRVYATSSTGLNSSVLTADFTCNNAASNLVPAVEITSGPKGVISYDNPRFEWQGYDPDGAVTGYYYSMDSAPPGTWTTGTAHQFTDLSNGSHTFRIIATDNEGGNSAVVSRHFTLDESAGVVVKFAAWPRSGAAPLTVDFTDKTDETITSWFWNFGDNASSNEQNPSHTYTNNGEYTVSLTVSGPSIGNSLVKPGYIIVGGSDWNTLGGNNQHTAYDPVTDLSLPLTLQWENQFANSRPTRPCAEAGNIFSALHANPGLEGVISIRLADGYQNWLHTESGISCVSHAAVFDDKVYWQFIANSSNDELIYCFSAESADILWSAEWDAQWESYEAPCVENGSLILCGGHFGGMYSFDISNGNQNWFRSHLQYDETTPCLWNGVAYTHYPGTGIYATSLSNGALLWARGDNSNWHGWEAVACSASNGILISPDPVTAWDLPTQSFMWEKTFRSFTAAIAENCVYVVSFTDFTLQKLHIDNGSEIWTFPLPEAASAQVVVTKNHVVAPTAGTTYFVNCVTGLEEWSCPHGGEVMTASGYVAISNEDDQYIVCYK